MAWRSTSSKARCNIGSFEQAGGESFAVWASGNICNRRRFNDPKLLSPRRTNSLSPRQWAAFSFLKNRAVAFVRVANEAWKRHKGVPAFPPSFDKIPPATRKRDSSTRFVIIIEILFFFLIIESESLKLGIIFENNIRAFSRYRIIYRWWIRRVLLKIIPVQLIWDSIIFLLADCPMFMYFYIFDQHRSSDRVNLYVAIRFLRISIQVIASISNINVSQNFISFSRKFVEYSNSML